MAVVEVKNLSKYYNLYKGSFERFKEALHPLRKKYHATHTVLNNISFTINEGEVVGIIGRNGCGKSTLLKILAGVLTQSNGECVVNGKVSALLELGSGFNPEYTGLENVYFSTSLMGFSKKETDDCIQSIIDFADIGEYIHQPVKTYSSGMAIRLAFAVSVNIDPDILIVDEALSVGDIRFQQKSLRKMKDLMTRAKAIIFVTHDMGTVLNFCNRAIWLKEGDIFQDGAPEDVCKDYLSFMGHNQVSSKKVEAKLDFSQLSEDEKLEFYIDAISKGDKFLKIEGWAIHKERSDYFEKNLVLSTGSKRYTFMSEKVERQDVNFAFPELNFDSNYHGFSVQIPIENINDVDEFDLVLVSSYTKGYASKKMLGSYKLSELNSIHSDSNTFDSVDVCENYGSKSAEIIGVNLRDASSGVKINLFKGGESVEYFVKVKAHSLIENPIVGIIIKDNYGNQIIGINSFIYKQTLQNIKFGEEIVVRFYFTLPLLKEGVYTISPAISNGTQDDHVVVHWVHDASIFEIRTNDARQKIGVIMAPENVEIGRI